MKRTGKATTLMAVAGLSITMLGCSADATGDESSNTDTLKVGALLPLSGSAAPYGEYIRDGAQMAVDKINADGGLNDTTTLELEVLDTEGMPDKAVTQMQQLIGDDSPYVLSTLSSQTLALNPIANQNETVLVNAGAQSNALGVDNDYLYNQLPLIDDEYEVLADQLDENGHTTAAIINTNDDGGRDAASSFIEHWESADNEVVAHEEAEHGTTDFRAQLQKLRSSDADVLVLGIFGEDTVDAVDQTREIGWEVTLANTSWANIPQVTNNPNAEGMVLTTLPYEPASSFADQYSQNHDAGPTIFVANGYDAVMQLTTVAEHSGENTLDGESIKLQLDSIEEFPEQASTSYNYSDLGVINRPIGTMTVGDEE